MPRIMREFECSSCGNVQERFIDTAVTEVDCRYCGEKAHRIIGMPTVKLEGISGSFPGAHSKWARVREEKARQKRQRDS